MAIKDYRTGFPGYGSQTHTIIAFIAFAWPWIDDFDMFGANNSHFVSNTNFQFTKHLHSCRPQPIFPKAMMHRVSCFGLIPQWSNLVFPTRHFVRVCMVLSFRDKSHDQVAIFRSPLIQNFLHCRIWWGPLSFLFQFLLSWQTVQKGEKLLIILFDKINDTRTTVIIFKWDKIFGSTWSWDEERTK